MVFKRNFALLLATATIISFTAGCQMLSPEQEGMVDVVAQPSDQENLPPPIDSAEPSNDTPQDQDIPQDQPDNHGPVKLNPQLGDLMGFDLKAAPLKAPSNVPADFFEKHPNFNTFSYSVQSKIYERFRKMPTLGGEGYFLTAMGPGIPTPIKMGGCSPENVVSEFICIYKPLPDEQGGDIFTDDPGVDLALVVDADQWAAFQPITITAFNDQDPESPISEISFYKDNNDVGIIKLDKTVGLDATGGKTHIVIDTFKTQNGVDVDFQKTLDVYRTVSAQVDANFQAWAIADPNLDIDSDAAEADANKIANNALVYADKVKVKVKLDAKTPYSPGIEMYFSNYDKNGVLRNYSVVGGSSSRKDIAEKDENNIDIRTYSTALYLHYGLNRIEVIGKEVGNKPVTGIKFDVYNYAKPKVLVDKTLFAQTDGQGKEIKNIDFGFCLAGAIKGVQSFNPGGQGVMPPSVDEEHCANNEFAGKLELKLNGKSVNCPLDENTQKVTCSDIPYSGGNYVENLTPRFGANLVEILADDVLIYSKPILFGDPLYLVKNGNIVNDGKNFTPRGINVDVHESLIASSYGGMRGILQRFLNSDQDEDSDGTTDREELVQGIFKTKEITPIEECLETGGTIGGSTSVEFKDNGTFRLGSIDIKDFTPSDDGSLHLEVQVNGLHGDVKAINISIKDGNGDTTSEEAKKAQQLAARQFSFYIYKLVANLKVKLEKGKDAPIRLNILAGKRITNRWDDLSFDVGDWYDIIGDHPGDGAYLYINPEVDFGSAKFDSQTGLVTQQFHSSIENALLCSLEKTLNKTLAEDSEVVRKLFVEDDESPIEQSVFRFPFDFDVFGRNLKFNIDLDVSSKSDGKVSIDSQGLHLQDIAFRLSPTLANLEKLANKAKSLFSLSRYNPQAAASLQLDETYNTGVRLSEDAINMVLASMVSSIGRLDLDPNFYAKEDIFPSKYIYPMGEKLATGIDLNRDGRYDEIDQKTPILWRVVFNEATPPTVTLMDSAELTNLAKSDPFFAADATNPYFRVTIPNLRIEAYKEKFVDDYEGSSGDEEVSQFPFLLKQEKLPPGYKKYCRVAVKDTGNLPQDKGLLSVTTTIHIPMNGGGFTKTNQNERPCLSRDKDPEINPAEPERVKVVSIPRANGIVESYDPAHPRTSSDNLGVPIYVANVSTSFIIKYAGMSRMAPADELYLNPGVDPKSYEKNYIHVQTPASETTTINIIHVVENNSDVDDGAIESIIKVVAKGALIGENRALNELRIELPSSIDLKDSDSDLLQDIGLETIKLLGGDNKTYPKVEIGDSPWYLNIEVPLVLGFHHEGGGK